ncbi:TlpA disulfide reductase family protein [Noviherbaspirillum sp.]|uniref:TlpA family protein disulfide reductase n=1 Tax=Noviherbaspirillum sp. TaxID=1926288 RepID=UPI0025CC466E|nr:TlpA disulfide reductase family protein [Noviherbaspirillum sp.]
MLSLRKLLLGACLSLLAGTLNAAELRVGDSPVLPAVRSIDGKTIDAAALRGKLLVVSYFSSGCPFCMNEAPKLQKLYRENRDKLTVIGVNIERNDPEQRAKTERWIAKYKLSYPVTTDFSAFENAFGRLKGLPVNQVFDKNGKVLRIDIGEIFDEDFDDIARLAR